MGATSAMYSETWQKLPDSIFHDWPPYRDEVSIPAMAKRLICEHGIVNGDIIIGSSLGGIIACEIANQLQLKQLVLIGSAVDKHEINTCLDVLHPLIDCSASGGMRPLEFLYSGDLSGLGVCG